MQEIRETRLNRELIDRLVGVESPELMKEFARRRDELQGRLESGETQKATVIEHRRIGRNDPCPCGSGVKFKKCCGSRLPENDERLTPLTPPQPMDAGVKADTESKTLAEADKFVQSLVKRADVTHPYPLWHGWALREAYRAGYEAAMKARAAAEAGGE